MPIDVEDMVDDRDLVPDEVGDEEGAQDAEPERARRSSSKGSASSMTPMPGEQRAHEEGQPRVQPGCSGEAERREDAADRCREIHQRSRVRLRAAVTLCPRVAAREAAIIRPRPAKMQEMVIYGVSFDMVGKQPIVLLKTADGNKFLPIWIGHPEAAAILMKLQGASTPRPMTHDLVTEMLAQLEARVVRIAVTELRENTFYALITVVVNGSELEIDSRPSDAIALAVRAGAPIFAADSVIEESAIEFEHEDVNEEEVVEEFKKFLDDVKPEDFSAEKDS